MKKVLTTFACFFSLACGASAQRLPEFAKPENYQLTFTPDLEKATFTGNEAIRIKVLTPTSQIVLNAAEIEIQQATLTAAGATHKATVTLDKDKEQATLTFNTTIPSGPATLKIEYTGLLNDKLRGLYLGKDDQGRKYAATQFEAQDARRAFPSFDEPAYKATFDITAIADKGLVAISNGNVVSDTPGPGEGKHTVRFATSPRMSSYLAALIVGNFESIEGGVDGIPIRVWTTPGKKEMGRFPLEAAEHVMHYYNQYFTVKYPYGKLDLIGLPDFSAGAMENTACITFREILLLADDTTSLDLRKTIASVIAHEMAHQWFGDLVTMKWWDDLWLNEGFATWMSSKPVAAWKPEWDLPLNEIQNTTYAMGQDSLIHTHPIRQNAETSAEIVENTDSITYTKTAAVLRMIEAYLGPDTFRAGVNAYLKQHAYSNATAADFWNAQTQTSGKPVDKILPTFIDQPGLPFISVKASCSGNAESISLEQHRYYRDRARFEGESSELWQIPVCLKEDGQGKTSEHCELLSQKQQTVHAKECSPWVFANAGAKGYYRAGYSAEAVRELAHNAEIALTPAERIVLLSDVWAAVEVDRAQVGDYLALAQGMQSERDATVFSQMVEPLQFINEHMLDERDRPAFQAWVRQLLAPAAAEIGWETKPGEPATRDSLRATLMFGLGRIGHDPQVIARAHKMANQAVENPASVDHELAFGAMAIAAEDGDAAFFDRVLAALKSAKSPEEYYLFQGALGHFSNRALIQRTLDYALSPEARSQDSPQLIAGTLFRPASQRMGWDFIRAHWDKIQELGGPFAGAQIVGSTSAFCDAGLRDEAMQFFAAHPSTAYERALKQAEETMNYCIDFKAQQQSKLAAWLQNSGSKQDGAGGGAGTQN